MGQYGPNMLVMSSSNSKIAKNALFLYIRMLLVMGVTLYSSRVVLDVLGIDDYGIYNLIGGVVVLFTFLSSAMTTATQRYLCTSIAEEKPEQTQSLFSSSLMAHLILIAILVLIAETIGLWFIRTQLVIPPDRIAATNTIYQLTILTSVLNVYRIPFSAAILAYEKMSFYAYAGVVEVILKLLILWPLSMAQGDRLILYGILVAGVNLVILIWHIQYSHCHLENTRHRLATGNHRKVKEIFMFAGWSSFSAIANIGSRQGLNILVNIFYGVTANAAIGIMQQVSNAVYQFISNFMSAINPPLMKEYARKDFQSVRKLLVSSTKFSFFLMLTLTTPIIFNIESILHLWLKEVPPLTGMLCAFALIALIPNTIGGAIWTIMQASGRIQRYQIIISSVIVLNLPVYYIILKSGLPVHYTIMVQFVTNMAVVFIGAHMGLKELGMNIRALSSQILLPDFGTLLICWSLIAGLNHLIPVSTSTNVMALACKCLAEITIVAATVWTTGLKREEKLKLKKLLTRKFSPQAKT